MLPTQASAVSSVSDGFAKPLTNVAMMKQQLTALITQSERQSQQLSMMIDLNKKQKEEHDAQLKQHKEESNAQMASLREIIDLLKTKGGST